MDPERASGVTKGRYVCPKCGSQLYVVTLYTGFDVELIDMEYRKPVHVDTSERTEVHEITYKCYKLFGSPPTSCGWEGDQEWFDSIGEAEKDEL